MIVLGIETSCDETAISLIQADNPRASAPLSAKIRVLADKTLSQIALHTQYGGVFPNMAKREHAKNLIPLLKTVLKEAGFLKLKVSSSKLQVEDSNFKISKYQNIKIIFEKEPKLLEQFLTFIPTVAKPPTRPVRSYEGSQRDFASNGIDAIAVTEGPGLEPCLWTGINFAKALSLAWDIPVIPVNHMEGHIFSSLLRRENMTPVNYSLLTINFPALVLLISGGHTELVLVKDWFQYEIIGETRDDAVGEAFDKVARLLGLPYPGGPQISLLAEEARKSGVIRSKLPARRLAGGEVSSSETKNLKLKTINLPRPMLHSGDFDFSFSGVKTAVLYLLKKFEKEWHENHPRESAFAICDNPRLQKEIALEFENAVTEVLVAKTKAAAEQYGTQALLIGGGVIANTHIRKGFEALGEELGVPMLIPENNLTTDNALMIAVAGLLRFSRKDGSTEPQREDMRAKGNLKLDEMSQVC